LKTDKFPATWTIKTLMDSWYSHLREMVSNVETDLPFDRLCFQAQTDPAYSDIVNRWSIMDPRTKEDAWVSLTELASKAKNEMMPVCVRCGECCKKGSPTLSAEDLKLLKEERIPWGELLTLRKGEPVHSNVTDEAFYLEDEKIKIRETLGNKVCTFFLDGDKSCTIHKYKPVQCRAQACWDESLAEQQAKLPSLTRKMIFADIPPVLELIDEHERRCSFTSFEKAFNELSKTKGDSIDEILSMLAFDEHIREFALKELNIPKETMNLLFGRPLTTFAKLFGFKVQKSDDGTRTLLPLKEDG